MSRTRRSRHGRPARRTSSSPTTKARSLRWRRAMRWRRRNATEICPDPPVSPTSSSPRRWGVWKKASPFSKRLVKNGQRFSRCLVGALVGKAKPFQQPSTDTVSRVTLHRARPDRTHQARRNGHLSVLQKKVADPELALDAILARPASRPPVAARMATFKRACAPRAFDQRHPLFASKILATAR